MTPRQRQSLAKYLYDLSKGFGLALGGGLVANKLGPVASVMLVIGALFTFEAAFELEREGTDDATERI
ncbi:MAG TPA: hypothetical protein VIG57_01050 [Candidatus Entotheonella sp.]|jgi:hypothetical protein